MTSKVLVVDVQVVLDRSGRVGILLGLFSLGVGSMGSRCLTLRQGFCWALAYRMVFWWWK